MLTLCLPAERRFRDRLGRGARQEEKEEGGGVCMKGEVVEGQTKEAGDGWRDRENQGGCKRRCSG